MNSLFDFTRLFAIVVTTVLLQSFVPSLNWFPGLKAAEAAGRNLTVKEINVLFKMF